jgi:uncharacterized membrane protein
MFESETGVVAILGWWLAFAGSHLALSSQRLRPLLVARIGQGPFMGVYSIVALATFFPLVSVYLDHIHAGPALWMIGSFPGVRILTQLVSVVAFAIVAGSFFQPSPTGMVPADGARVYGLLRITRHPMFMPLGAWGAVHLLVNGFAADVAFFGGMAAFALVGCAHQDSRKRVEGGAGMDEFFAETSLLPFAAILTGRNRLVLGELPWLGLGLGAALSWGFYLAHPMMFGAG